MPESRRATAEYHDEYSETLVTEHRKLEAALLSDTVSILERAHTVPGDGVNRRRTGRNAGAGRVAVIVVDQEGRLSGIATDRDLLKRIRGVGHDATQTRLVEVMTRDPEALQPEDRICYAVNRMMTRGCRTVPLVDGEGRPVGMVTVEDIAKWLAGLFPEAILNLRPGDRLKPPAERDGG
jgi:CBS domain-containing protein